eukprot:3297220-Rhodomonas_salina.2
MHLTVPDALHRALRPDSRGHVRMQPATRAGGHHSPNTLSATTAALLKACSHPSNPTPPASSRRCSGTVASSRSIQEPRAWTRHATNTLWTEHTLPTSSSNPRPPQALHEPRDRAETASIARE